MKVGIYGDRKTTSLQDKIFTGIFSNKTNSEIVRETGACISYVEKLRNHHNVDVLWKGR